MGKPWFHPKDYGYGAGLPCSWQGWVLLAGYMALMIGVSLWLMPQRPGLAAGLMAVATVLLVIVCAAKTRGGWRWRWGQHE